MKQATATDWAAFTCDIRFRTTYEIFAELTKSCEAQQQHGDGSTRRQPVCLFLGGGMAAGKSTVREIIGKDVFWSSVRGSLLLSDRHFGC